MKPLRSTVFGRARWRENGWHAEPHNAVSKGTPGAQLRNSRKRPALAEHPIAVHQLLGEDDDRFFIRKSHVSGAGGQSLALVA